MTVRTFPLPPMVNDRISHAALGRQMIRALRNDGFFQVSLEAAHAEVTQHAVDLQRIGEKLLALVALGLGLSIDALTRLTRTHTDCGLLLIAARYDAPGVLTVLPGDMLQFFTDRHFL